MEQGTHNPLVGGSNPSGPTNPFNNLQEIDRLAERLWLRGGCGYLLSCCRRVEPINPLDIRAGNPMPSETL